MHLRMRALHATRNCPVGKALYAMRSLCLQCPARHQRDQEDGMLARPTLPRGCGGGYTVLQAGPLIRARGNLDAASS